MTNFMITDAQATELVDAIQDYKSGDDIYIAVLPDGGLHVSFALSTVTIFPDGMCDVD